MKFLSLLYGLMALWLVLLQSPAQSIPGDPAKQFLVPVTASTFVKGFPLILKIKAHGPQFVGLVDLFNDTANISIRLTSQETPNHYGISSTRGQGESWGNRDGSVTFDGTIFNEKALWEDQERTMLLDLSSLRPEVGNGRTMADVPPGKYLLQVTFPIVREAIASQPIKIILQAPNVAEIQFLSAVAQEVTQKTRRTTGWPVSWGEVLRGTVDISALSTAGLSETAKQQLQFHQFLLRLLTSEKPVKAINLDELRQLPVPAYLEPEKTSLLAEAQILALEGKAQTIQPQIDKLLKAEPGLAWRIEAAQAGKADWHAYKRNRDADWHPLTRAKTSGG